MSFSILNCTLCSKLFIYGPSQCHNQISSTKCLVKSVLYNPLIPQLRFTQKKIKKENMAVYGCNNAACGMP